MVLGEWMFACAARPFRWGSTMWQKKIFPWWNLAFSWHRTLYNSLGIPQLWRFSFLPFCDQDCVCRRGGGYEEQTCYIFKCTIVLWAGWGVQLFWKSKGTSQWILQQPVMIQPGFNFSNTLPLEFLYRVISYPNWKQLLHTFRVLVTLPVCEKSIM